MKNAIRKTLLACAVTAMMGFGASASASTFPEFKVNETVITGIGDPSSRVIADRIVGGYVENIDFSPTSSSAGEFSVSLYWAANQFFLSPTLTAETSQLGSGKYGLYATYSASGTYIQSANNVTTFSYTPNTGSLELFADLTPLDKISNGVLIATGIPTYGEGELTLNSNNCRNKITCGSFGATTTFELNELGKKYFVEPTPFYSLSMQSGNLTKFTVGVDQSIVGSLDVFFDNTVPEPSTVALLGLGLLGFAASRRKRK